MELIERVDLRAVHFLNSIKFDKFKNDCIDCANKEGKPRPKETDIKTWFDMLKSFCKTNIKSKGHTKRIYAYSLNTPAGLGGRLFSGGSLQGIWGKYRGLLMREVGSDIDMSNAHPTILRYICRKHNIDCPFLDYYINNRDKCLSEFDSRSSGKHLYLVATNSDKNIRKANLPKNFKNYDKEMKEIQSKLIVLPEYKNLFETIPEYKQSKNYNGSATNRILCYYENEILQKAIHAINSRGIEIAILMFDGVMVYGNHYNDNSLLQEITDYVAAEFPDLNMKWAYKEHDESLEVPDDFDDTDYEGVALYRFAGDDKTAAEFLFDELKTTVITHKKRLFMKHNNVWIDNFDNIQDYLLDYIMKSNISRPNKEFEFVPYVQNLKAAKNVRETLIMRFKTYEHDNNIYDKFHSTTKNRLCFKDGVLDFVAKRFYTWKEVDFEYYTTIMIQYDYKEYFNNPDFELIEKIYNDIFVSMFGDKTKRALQFYGRAITGHLEDKNWMEFLGNRDCGKGVMYDGLSAAFESYVLPFELGNILYERKGSQDLQEISRKLYWLLDYEFVRLSISQETPPKDSKQIVNGKMLKKLCGGGDVHTARRNYDRCDTHFKIDTTFSFWGNDPLQIDSKDCWEHCVHLSSVNQYKTQDEIDAMKTSGDDELLWSSYKVRDGSLKDKCISDPWKKAIVYILYKNYINKVVNIESIDEDDDIDGDKMSVRRKILYNYQITKNGNDAVIINDLLGVVTDDKKKIHNELISMGIIKKKSGKRDDTQNKWCYFGLKQKVKQEITPPIAGPVAAEQIIIMGSAAAFGNINDNNEFCDDEC